MKTIILSLTLIMMLSCKKEGVNYPQEEKFNEMVNHLDLNCLDTSSSDFFKAIINGKNACYYDGVNNMKKELSYRNYFVTGSPSTTTQPPKDAGHVILFGITLDLEKGQKYQNWVEFSTPRFDLGISKEMFLDSLFSISDHQIAGKNFPNGIKVKLSMYDKKQKSGGSVYSFYSEVGCQSSESYLRFRKVEKKVEFGYKYYDIEMEVQCDLFYHVNDDGYAQYGKEGLWGKLENGLLKMKVRL